MSPNVSRVAATAVDLRSQRTQNQIRDAFIGLLIERPFAQITVTALTQAAGINRATFYRHYADIHDLAERLTDLLFADTLAHLEAGAGENDAAHWTALFTHAAAYAPFYRAMLQPGGIPNFRQRVEMVVAQQMRQALPLLGFDDQQAQKMPAPLAVQYLAAAQVGFIQWWLENDMPFPPETAAAYLMSLHLNGGWWALGLRR